MYLVFAILRESADGSQYVSHRDSCAWNHAENDLPGPTNLPTDGVNPFNDGSFASDEDLDGLLEAPGGRGRRDLETYGCDLSKHRFQNFVPPPPPPAVRRELAGVIPYGRVTPYLL